MTAHTFPARWAGECAECFASFEEGDEIGYIAGEICCEDCCEMQQDSW